MRGAFVLLIIGVVAAAAGGCGAGRKVRVASRRPPVERTSATPYLGDQDGEVEEGVSSEGFRDADDRRYTAYGHPATQRDARAIATVVDRYYSATDAGDGRKACLLMTAGLAQAIAAKYPSPPQIQMASARAGAPERRVKPERRTCSSGMAFLFAHFPNQLRARVVVVGVRVLDRHAYALVGSRNIRASFVTLYREPGGWRVHVPFSLDFS